MGLEAIVADLDVMRLSIRVGLVGIMRLMAVLKR
jgi:hypothetical protein